MSPPPFEGFPSLKRLYREVIITEKLDGTNAQVLITDDGDIFAGSRNRWITPEDDNYGFARWVQENKDELLELGPGKHFGEWWGLGIQRGYGVYHKMFSLFRSRQDQPDCCLTVPYLYTGMFSDNAITEVLADLKANGSRAVPGFMNPEGIVIYHTHSRQSFKVTLDNNDQHKWENLQ
jgi:hypothetical protein